MSRRVVISRVSAASVIPTVIAAVLMLAASAHTLFAEGKHVVAQGRVLSPSGEGMAGWPVQVIATQRYIELKRFATGGDMVTAARATTDASGYYAIDVPKDRHFQFWFLRFVEAGQLDTVKYLYPEDVEITADVRRGRVAAVDKTIKLNPDWPEVERRIGEAGGESTERGRILRSLGLPEKHVRDELTGADEWWYFTRGILYTFHGSQPAVERRFEPVKPPPDAAPSSRPTADTPGSGGHPR